MPLTLKRSITASLWHDVCNKENSLKEFRLKAEGKTKILTVFRLTCFSLLLNKR
jgi:hypothetical protein